jgi:hypothetical protein
LIRLPILLLHWYDSPLMIDPNQTVVCGSPAAEWFAGVGTLVLAFVAVFQQWLQQLIVRPRLELSARVSRPDAEKSRWWKKETDVYYFRLGIRNIGNKAAHDVQTYLARVERLRQDNQYEPVDKFSPMNLIWTHTGKATKDIVLPGMPPVFCDLGHIADPARKVRTGEDVASTAEYETVLALDLEVLPSSGGHLLAAGTYRFDLIVAASNSKPRPYNLEVKVTGKWFPEEDRMLRDGFGMRLL